MTEAAKKCKECGKTRPIEEFYVTRTYAPTGRKYYASKCKECCSTKTKEDRPVLVFGDVHAPYSKKGWIEFLQSVHAKFNCDPRVVCDGDLLDFHAMSRHTTEMGAFSAEDEYELALEEVAKLAKVFPEGDLVTGNHCFSSDTQLLTKRGWIDYTDIRKDDMVFSMKDDLWAEWVNIDNIIIKHHNGEMIRAASSQVDMLVTPEHRILHWPTSSKKSLKYSLASEITARQYIFTAGNLESNYERKLQHAKVKLGAWLLTDGGATSNGYLSIYQSKQVFVNEIRDLLNELNINYTETVRDRDITHICGRELLKKPLPAHEFHINAESSREYIHLIKDTEWINNLGSECFELFLQTVIDADGSRNRGYINATIYGTSDWLDRLQIACVTHGVRACKKQDNRGHFLLRVTHTDKTTVCFQDKQIEPYNGEVWCLSVKNTNFMVRRKGMPFFSGNCSIPHRQMREIGLSPKLLKSNNELYGLPDSWTVHPHYFVIKPNSWNVLVEHGIGSGGMYGCANTAKAKRTSFVQGHTHSQAMVKFFRNYRDTIFGMNTGCLCDETSPAMRYGAYNRNKGVLGCGVVFNGSNAIFVPWDKANNE